MVMLKVLQQYYNATKDDRVITLMTRYFQYQLKELLVKKLDNWSWWAAQRGGDNLLVVYWLYNITGDKYLLELAEILHAQWPYPTAQLTVVDCLFVGVAQRTYGPTRKALEATFEAVRGRTVRPDRRRR